MEVKNKVVLVTGASGGIGRAIARAFAQQGAQLALHYHKNRGAAEKIMKTHHDRIEINPDVMLGKPVIKGTRIPVELIIRKLGEGAVLEDLLDAYPNLEKEDIQAALLYAAEHMGNETVIYLKTGT